MHKYFINANSKHGLGNWLHAFINLLDTVKLSFRKVHHFTLSQQCMKPHFPISLPQFGGNILFHSTLSLKAICMVRNHIPLLFWFAVILLPVRFSVSCPLFFLVIFLTFLLSKFVFLCSLCLFYICFLLGFYLLFTFER